MTDEELVDALTDDVAGGHVEWVGVRGVYDDEHEHFRQVEIKLRDGRMLILETAPFDTNEHDAIVARWAR